MCLNVFSYWRYLEKQIRKVNAAQYNKVIMYLQKLFHFCNILKVLYLVNTVTYKVL